MRASTLTLAAALAVTSTCTGHVPPGVNPAPVRLTRAAGVPLSPLAQIGRAMFFDPRLSGSGAISCATCHDPALAYGPPDDLARQLASRGVAVDLRRAVPSLRYVDRAPLFGIGPDREDDDTHRSFGTTLINVRGLGRKTAGARADPLPNVPRGGLFWDGRSGSFQMQAALPLLNPAEMANADQAALVTKIRTLGYAVRLERALGAEDVNSAPSSQLLDEALFAIARFEFEDVSFHPYTSRYDRWLEGEGRLTTSELRGLRVFDDPARGNCAACHLDRPGPDGRPPAFTDWQYEALGVPRNRRLAANRDPRSFDLGLCGPVRTDLERQPQWCGMFRTPSLRNVAVRRAFFHNGAYTSLEEVVRFYNLRDTRASLIYPVQQDRVLKFDDLPRALQHNVDVLDPPFDRHDGDPPPMAPQDVRDLVAFLQTLTDDP